jgi:hypothetical protein
MLLVSLYYLIRPQQQRRRDRKAEGLGGLRIHDELDSIDLLERKVGRS